MSFYPTRPDGASAAGSAAAWALHRTGGEWQKKFSGDASAVRSGDFTRVRPDPYELLTQAWAKADENDNRDNTRAVMKNRTAIPWRAGALRHFCGGNIFFGWGIQAGGIATRTETHTYPGYGSVTFSVTEYSYHLYFAPWAGTRAIRGWDSEGSQTVMSPANDFWWAMPTVRSAFVGHALVSGVEGDYSCFTRMRRKGRLDPGGRELEDPEIVLCNRKSDDAYVVSLPIGGFTHPQAEFLWAPIPIATENYLWLFLVEGAYFHTGVKTLPKMWMLRLSKTGFTSVFPFDVTGQVFADWMANSLVLHDPTWVPEVFDNAQPLYYFSTPRLAALPGDRVLLATAFLDKFDESGSIRHYSTAKMHRISPEGAVNEVFADDQRKADLMPNGGGYVMNIPHSFVEGMYPIGDGRVIAKVCRGAVLPGLVASRPQADTWDVPWSAIDDRGYAVDWYRSLDDGLTFSPFTPVGLPASVNHHIGDVMVMEPWGRSPATLLVACRDQGNGHYAIYRSKDGGLEWDRYSILRKGDELRSAAAQNDGDPVFMDGIHYQESDAGFNAYRMIWRAPDFKHPVDPVIPDRFARQE